MYILKVLLLLNYIQSISGEVSLPQWFGDHMVLQSNAEVKSQNSVLNGRAASVRQNVKTSFILNLNVIHQQHNYTMTVREGDDKCDVRI